MGKIIAAMNMTLDGFCDHTAGIADEEIHQHYADMLKGAGALLYGRVTYQLMEDYWPSVVKTPTGDKSTDEFAVAIDNSKKIVYSRTLKSVTWKNTVLKHEIDKDELKAMSRETTAPILVGSPGLIVSLTNLDLIDEYQLNINPILLGSGKALFAKLKHRVDLELYHTKKFNCGAIILYYNRNHTHA